MNRLYLQISAMHLAAYIKQNPWVLGIALSLFFLPLKLYGYETSYLNIHAARDWERGWQMLNGEHFWWHGPELLFRGSIPGYFFNVLCGIFHFPVRAPLLAAMSPAILFAGSIFFVHDGLRRLYGILLASFVTVVYASFPIGTVLLRYLWNPSYLFLFTALSFWFLCLAATRRDRRFVACSILSLLLAFQIHLTAGMVLLSVLITSVVTGLIPSKRSFAILGLASAMFFAPYILDQWYNNWPDQASRLFLSVDPSIDMNRLQFNPNFFLPLAVQFIHQPPLDAFGLNQTFPFSYFEHYYGSSSSARSLGLLAFWVSLPFSLAVLLGLCAGSRCLRNSRSPRSVVLLFGFAWVMATVFPQAVWNPKTMLHGEGHFGIPVRYFIILWPIQFLFMAEGLSFLRERLSGIVTHAGLWLCVAAAPIILVFITLTVSFHVQAKRSGEPFRYLHIPDWPVHALRDKLALAEHLVNSYGVDEELFLTRVYTEGAVLFLTEESLDFELRSALERNVTPPEADPELFYFIYKPHNHERIVGAYEEVETVSFGSLSLLVYRPLMDQSDVEIDPSASWWWY